MIGYGLGDSWRHYYNYLHYVDYIVIAVLVVLLVRYLLIRRDQKVESQKHNA